MPDYKFWNDRWVAGQIGFHLPKPHSGLVKFASVFLGHDNIFVPLCGKSQDMSFLRSLGHQITAVEFSELAIMDFMKENNLFLNKTVLNDFDLYHGEGYKIYQGDLFKLSSIELSGITACYDRASMVAFCREERLRYADFLNHQAPELELILAPVLDYGAGIETGPPYSVTSEELIEVYGDHFSLEELGRVTTTVRETNAFEVTWLLKRK